MRWISATLTFFAALTAYADAEPALNRLISEGNRAYELSQATRIKECADSAATILANSGFTGDRLHDFSASVLRLYGNYHYENCAPDSADTYYRKAQAIIDANPNTHFGSLTRLLLLRDRAQLCYQLADYAGATALMARADDELEYSAPYLTDGDDWLITKLTYAMCLARLKDFDRALEIADTQLANATDKTSLDYARARRMRGKILLLANAGRQGALKAYKAYFDTQKRYALDNFAAMTAPQRAEYWRTLRPFIADCFQLEDADPAFLYDVALFSKGLLLQLERLSGEGAASQAALKSLRARWTDVRSHLKPGQAAIEFIQYEKDGSQHMAALVLKGGSRPEFVRMAPPADVLALAGRDMQSTSRQGKDSLYSDVRLHNLAWNQELLAAIKGCRRVYFAPDGYQHRLAIEYLPPVSDMEMYRLTSTRRLLESSAPLTAASPTLLIGGVNYDLDKAPGATVQNDSSAYARYLGTRFPRLSAESNEAKAIYDRRGNPADTLVVASKASEASFRSLAPAYEAILVSTHGHLASSSPLPTDLKPGADDNSLSQNIIALAGVNSYLQNPDFDSRAHADGLLSARELAGMDLSKCRLFTVSACQSALGDISADGVFGLQRGLKNAGVDAMLLSLWNVSSDATAALMQAFYAELAAGKSIGRAFAAARKAIMEQEPDSAAEPQYAFRFNPAIMASRRVRTDAPASFASPQFVDAFILIDALD